MPPFVLDESSNPVLFTLSGACTVDEARGVHTALAGALAAHEVVALDLGKVEYADITLVQLLLAALQEAQDRGKRLELAGEASKVVLQALRLAGVEQNAFIGNLFPKATSSG